MDHVTVTLSGTAQRGRRQTGDVLGDNDKSCPRYLVLAQARAQQKKTLPIVGHNSALFESLFLIVFIGLTDKRGGVVELMQRDPLPETRTNGARRSD